MKPNRRPLSGHVLTTLLDDRHWGKDTTPTDVLSLVGLFIVGPGARAFGITNGSSAPLHFDQTLLPRFLPGYANNTSCGFPWGCRTVEDTNSYDDFPLTGVHRHYDFTIRRGFIAPDGINRSVILVNGQFPGPMIDANWGDTVNIKVHNNIDSFEDLQPEDTSIHWHGLNQKVTPWYDGVPSVSQCPIAPDKFFEYSFVATNYGSSWWHAHYSSQYTAGIFEPMVIHGPVEKSIEYDIDLGPVLLTDWHHMQYFHQVEQLMDNRTNIIPAPDNNLIQGKAAYLCPNSTGFGYTNLTTFQITNGVNGSVIGHHRSLPNPGPGPEVCIRNPDFAKLKVERGKKYRLRLINAGAAAVQRFSIDSHNLTVFTNDFVPIVPYSTQVVSLTGGQRSDVILEANADGDSFWIRSNMSDFLNGAGLIPGSVQPLAQAALYYDGADYAVSPTSTATEYNDTASPGNDNSALTEPVYPIAVKVPDLTLNITIGIGFNDTGHFLWTMNNSSFRANLNDPILLEAKFKHDYFPDHPEWNVYNTGAAKTVRLIIDATALASHGMHLHGHDFMVLAEGHGVWDGTIVRPENPQRRDVHMLPILGSTDLPGKPPDRPYMVLQFEQDNPGVWPLHCHVSWHVNAGLSINIMERPEDITTYRIPPVMAQTCRDWWKFSGHHVIDQINSGL